MTDETDPRTARIRKLNDEFRQNPRESRGRVNATRAIALLPDETQKRIYDGVINYDWSSGDEGNDPYGEHDFGFIDDRSIGKIIWKIDYYDADLEYGSEDPSDPEQTTRVLTIMLAIEY